MPPSPRMVFTISSTKPAAWGLELAPTNDHSSSASRAESSDPAFKMRSVSYTHLASLLEVEHMPERCAALIDELVSIRKSKGWSQQDLSDACGLKQSVIARLESKKNTPTLSTVYKITDALGVALTISTIDA